MNTAPQNFPMQTISFAGPIQYPASKNFRNACCGAVNSGAKELVILFSSGGGDVVEGFALHHFLLALPVTLTMHCVGVVESIAMVVFLAGKNRYCCPGATFLFHDYSWTSTAAETLTRRQVSDRVMLLEISKARMIEMLKTKANFTDADFNSLQLFDQTSVQTDVFAKQKGIVHEIKEATIIPGTPVFNVDF